jgi:hypothetical protein
MNTSQYFAFHAKWGSNSSDATGGSMKITGTPYVQVNTTDGYVNVARALAHKPQSVFVEGGKKVGEEWIDAEKRRYVTYEHSAVPTKLKVTL